MNDTLFLVGYALNRVRFSSNFFFLKTQLEVEKESLRKSSEDEYMVEYMIIRNLGTFTLLSLVRF